MSIVNRSKSRVCALSFNQADILYVDYQELHVVDLLQCVKVEGLDSPSGGVKVAIIHAANLASRICQYQMYQCQGDAVMTISYVNGDQIYATGDGVEVIRAGEIQICDDDDFAYVVAALQCTPPV